MRKILFVVLLLIMSLVHGQTAFAHGTGHAPVTDKQAITIATGGVEQLVARDVGLGFGQLDPSWNRLPEDAKRIESKEAAFYIVGVEHTGEARTLYFLMSRTGDIYDANFTGKFEGLQ